jgi:dihydroorotase
VNITQDFIEITTPDDWHLHFRDGEALAHTVPATARCFARAIVMPNLVPPVTTVEQAEAYHARILAAVPAGTPFEPLMTLYLTDRTDPAEMQKAAASRVVHACKLYPAGATTNSSGGVADLAGLYPLLEAMEKNDVPLLVHGEVTDRHVDIFDREKRFIDDHLAALVRRFPGLRVVFEHITTAEAVDFVREAPAHVAATLTPQHLMHNRNDMLVGGIRPHLYCLPILKARTHQLALQQAAISGNPKFFLGTDSAPHARHTKEAACGCAGCYSAPAAIELYAQIFEDLRALERLEGFASHFGPAFYRLPRNTGTLRLYRRDLAVPASLPYLDGGSIVPLAAGQTLRWSLTP